MACKGPLHMSSAACECCPDQVSTVLSAPPSGHAGQTPATPNHGPLTPDTCCRLCSSRQCPRNEGLVRSPGVCADGLRRRDPPQVRCSVAVVQFMGGCPLVRRGLGRAPFNNLAPLEGVCPPSPLSGPTDPPTHSP